MTGSDALGASHTSDPCPSWCAGNHGEVAPTHIGQQREILPGSKYHRICAAAIQQRGPFSPIGEPHVLVHGSKYRSRSAVLFAHLRDAQSLAVIVEILADATPGQHRELAEAIRAAAADITGAGQR